MLKVIIPPGLLILALPSAALPGRKAPLPMIRALLWSDAQVPLGSAQACHRDAKLGGFRLNLRLRLRTVGEGLNEKVVGLLSRAPLVRIWRWPANVLSRE